MATSSDRRETLEHHALALAWGAWTELGVSGWTRTHADWAIDPEPLIIFTAGLADTDPRLRDEATDWCIRHWRFVSRARLRNLLRGQPANVLESYGELAATVSNFAPVSWPGKTTPRAYAPTERSSLPPLERPSLVWLRLRATFGLAARTEVLRYFLSHDPKTTASVARLAGAIGYTKRNVADEAESLHRAGVLETRPVANRIEYLLAHRSELEGFIGVLPPLRPNWTALANVVLASLELATRVGHTPSETTPVKARQTYERIEDDLRELEIDVSLRDVHSSDLWPQLQSLAHRILTAWSQGDWPTPLHAVRSPTRRLPSSPNRR